MNFDIGLPPITTLLIALLVLVIVSDVLLELFSIRMSQCTGKIQNWFFEQFGQNLLLDYFISIFFQFFGFRKKAYFLQLSSLINVGSFTKRQCLIILLGSHIGIGLSFLLLLPGFVVVGAGLCALSFILSLFWKDQIRDFAVAIMALGLFLTLISLFDPFLASSTLNLHYIQLSGTLALGIVILSTLFFRTPVAFLLSLAVMHFFVGIHLFWLPLLFFIHGFISLVRFYGQIFQGRGRLRLTLGTSFSLQLSQLSIALLFYLSQMSFGDVLTPLFKAENFLIAFQKILVAYALYGAATLIFLTPVIFLLSLLPFFNRADEKKTDNQKIVNIDERGQCFSIHLSLFLLRQEFKKYVTSVHTMFKLSRESDFEEESINQKIVRYQGMLTRVGDELKELCFSIGRQRSYRWQVKEVMSYYKIVNQLELLIDDLAHVTSKLRKKNLEEEWERECRYWLGLQLKLFESFFDDTLGVGKDDSEKVQALMEKSYEILDRFFIDKKEVSQERLTSQTFYRITESLGSLAL